MLVNFLVKFNSNFPANSNNAKAVFLTSLKKSITKISQMKKLTFLAILVISCLTTKNLIARDYIQIVGSSTVYPFVTTIAETFGNNSNFKTPVVEATGTGGGFKLFCSGIANNYPDISNASRAIKKSEINLCIKNNVGELIEIKLGYDGIVLANSNQSKQYNLTREHIFLALAQKVPQNGKLVPNFYQTWNQIDPKLPNFKIEIYGPPPTSGTRDAFVELVMESACTTLEEFKKQYSDPKQLKKSCHIIRTDGKYIESGENDNLIIQNLIAIKMLLAYLVIVI